MSSTNLNRAQHQFGELSLSPKTSSASNNASSGATSSSALSASSSAFASTVKCSPSPTFGNNISSNGSNGGGIIRQQLTPANGRHLHHHQPNHYNRNSCSSAAGNSVENSNGSAHSAEIHDLIRFQKAIMMKYHYTHDQHFKNIADALKPQIEDKIREFQRRN